MSREWGCLALQAFFLCDFALKKKVDDCKTLKEAYGRASPAQERCENGSERGQFRVVSALLSDQYFEFSKSNFTGMKGLVRGVQKWPWTQVPSNTGLGTQVSIFFSNFVCVFQS